MKNGNGLKDSKLRRMYDGKRDDESIGWNWDYGMDLDLDFGIGDAMDDWKMAKLGFLLSGRLCRVWDGRFCKDYYSSSSSSGRDIIIGLLLRTGGEMKDFVTPDWIFVLPFAEFLPYLQKKRVPV